MHRPYSTIGHLIENIYSVCGSTRFFRATAQNQASLLGPIVRLTETVHASF